MREELKGENGQQNGRDAKKTEKKENGNGNETKQTQKEGGKKRKE